MNHKAAKASLWQRMLVTGAIGAMLSVGATSVYAGQCPANRIVADGKGQKMSAAKAKGLTDRVVNRINLINEPVMLKDHALRLRRLVIQPGGVCRGTATPTVRPSSPSSAVRSPNIAAPARFRSCTGPANRPPR
jgi:hypothetical protein